MVNPLWQIEILLGAQYQAELYCPYASNWLQSGIPSALLSTLSFPDGQISQSSFTPSQSVSSLASTGFASLTSRQPSLSSSASTQSARSSPSVSVNPSST